MDSAANPNSSFSSSSSSPSPWSDGGGGANPPPLVAPELLPHSAPKRPPPSLTEPLYKKARPDLAQDPANRTSETQVSSDLNVSSGHGNVPSSSAADAPPATESHVSVEGSVLPSYNGSSANSGYGGIASQQSFNGSMPQSNTNDLTSGLTSGLHGSFQSGFPNQGSFAPGAGKSSSGTSALFYKTKICTKFKLGTCTFNERCHFAHGEEDLRKPPQGWEELVKVGSSVNMGKVSVDPLRKSNKPCRYFSEGNCPYGDRCTFSHGNDQTQRNENLAVVDGAFASSNSSGSSVNYTGSSSRSNYKTRICTRWEKGEICSYGEKCHFAHGQTELRPYSAGQPVYNSGSGTVNQSDPYTNAYPGTGNYGNGQVTNTNGYSTNYNYWNPENSTTQSHVQPNVAPPPSQQSYVPQYQSYVQPTQTSQLNQGYGQPNIPTQNNQSYMEPNPTTPWSGNYSTDGGYVKSENNIAQYVPNQSQQQQQSAAYYGNVPSYQGINQTQSYVADGSQTSYQIEAKNGDSATYYNAAGYGTQQMTYIGGYNTA